MPPLPLGAGGFAALGGGDPKQSDHGRTAALQVAFALQDFGRKGAAYRLAA